MKYGKEIQDALYDVLKEVSEYKYLTDTTLGNKIKRALAKADGK